MRMMRLFCMCIPRSAWSARLKTIWLSGGGALSHGSAQLLSNELGKQVSLWDNTKRLEVFGDIDKAYLAAHSLELNVALGMVLRGSGLGK